MVYVALQVLLCPLLWIFLGQMIFATLIDHSGLLGMQTKKIDAFKLFGLLFIFIGGLIMLFGEYRSSTK